jgi:hypothetical protein
MALYVTRPTNKHLVLVWDWAVSEFGLLQCFWRKR